MEGRGQVGQGSCGAATGGRTLGCGRLVRAAAIHQIGEDLLVAQVAQPELAEEEEHPPAEERLDVRLVVGGRDQYEVGRPLEVLGVKAALDDLL